MAYKLILFDCDGTLVERDNGALLPGVREWFVAHGHEQSLAMCSNQGGVGLRYWMEKDGFGEPEQFPDEAAARAHLQAAAEAVDCPDLSVFVCFAYQSKKSGRWSPTPPGKGHLEEWQPEYRKPSPKLLEWAMLTEDAEPDETLYVGDSEEDRLAATRAGVKFSLAKEFFSHASQA
jgi:HAD superfamily hydrolase (TIGR01662 family)